jgi:hypothetical protein
MEEYSHETRKLAERILGLISESLGLESQCLVDAIGEPYQNITISYYPACPQPHLTLGLQVRTTAAYCHSSIHTVIQSYTSSSFV